MHSCTVVGVTADADIWCPDCAGEVYGDIDNPDTLDGEGNPLGVIFADSEAGDSPSHCNRCHELIDDSWTGSTCEYAIEALRDYIITPGDGSSYRGDPAVLDAWVNHLGWCNIDADPFDDYDGKTVIGIYNDLRAAEIRIEKEKDNA